MHVDPLRLGGIWRVGIVYDDSEAPRAVRRTGPLQWREVSAPSQVYFAGIGSLGANAGEEIVNGIVRRPELVW